MANGFFESFVAFFSPREEVHKHWYVPVDNFQFSSSDFYKMTETELKARKVPGLEMSRIQLSEGGLLSDKREYLRLQRERLIFDICAAPFGTSYFFSFRSIEKTLGIKPGEMVGFILAFLFVSGLLVHFLGLIYGFVALLTLILAIIFVMRNASSDGDLDCALLKTPVIGALYEIFFRNETYHREDTRLMYISTVNSITEKLVEEVTLDKGVKLLKRYDRKPIHGELYEERAKPLRNDTDEIPAAAA